MNFERRCQISSENVLNDRVISLKILTTTNNHTLRSASLPFIILVKQAHIRRLLATITAKKLLIYM